MSRRDTDRFAAGRDPSVSDAVYSMGGGASSSDARNFKRLLKGLQSDDESVVMTSLSELSDMLIYSSDERLLLSGFNGVQYIPELVRILRYSDSSCLFMATKIMIQLFDLLPASIGVAVQHEAPQVRTRYRKF